MSAEITWEETAKHNTRKDCWMVIDGNVYDVSKFLDEHPGGEEVLLEQGGLDASEAFHEIGHSDDAVALLKDLLVGSIKSSPKVVPAPKSAATPSSSGNSSLLILVPIVAIIAIVVYKFLET
ncbi:Cytochrome b5 [Nowakowskiella sp. JEL0078]|nr:Cytochrome b5 [Nowakowskiella sp. JEL0078]